MIERTSGAGVVSSAVNCKTARYISERSSLYVYLFSSLFHWRNPRCGKMKLLVFEWVEMKRTCMSMVMSASNCMAVSKAGSWFWSNLFYRSLVHHFSSLLFFLPPPPAAPPAPSPSPLPPLRLLPWTVS